jgi:hypothetical protein
VTGRADHFTLLPLLSNDWRDFFIKKSVRSLHSKFSRKEFSDLFPCCYYQCHLCFILGERSTCTEYDGYDVWSLVASCAHSVANAPRQSCSCLLCCAPLYDGSLMSLSQGNCHDSINLLFKFGWSNGLRCKPYLISLFARGIISLPELSYTRILGHRDLAGSTSVE